MIRYYLRIGFSVAIVVFLLFFAANHVSIIDRMVAFKEQRQSESNQIAITDLVGEVSAENDITLYADALGAGTYTLRYEDLNGSLEGYREICSLEITEDAPNPVYTGFIPENCAPVRAELIGVYDSQNNRVGSVPLGNLRKEYGSKLYTFGALSDVHMGYPTATEDFTKALQFLIHDQWAEFVCISGDITGSCTDEQLHAYQQVVSGFTRTAPVYAIRGNHDSPEYRNGDVTGLFDMPLYYSFQCGEDVFIMMGLSAERTDALFSREEMQWLYETLEANKNRRCFIFQHVRPVNSSGNALGIYTFDLWDGVEQALFDELLTHYPNVTLFHGHTHLKLELQEFDDTANYTAKDGYHSVHISSVTAPRTGNSDGPSSKEDLYYESQGYLVDVYENGIMLRGRDFVQDVYLPIAQYYLDTTLKDCAGMDGTDDTCTIHPDSQGIPLDWRVGLKTQKSNQAQVEVAGYSSSQRIEVEAGYSYRLCSKDAANMEAVACFYDSEGNYMNFLTFWDINQASGDNKALVQVIQPPEGAASMILRLKYPEDIESQILYRKRSHLSLTKYPDSKP